MTVEQNRHNLLNLIDLGNSTILKMKSAKVPLGYSPDFEEFIEEATLLLEDLMGVIEGYKEVHG